MSGLDLSKNGVSLHFALPEGENEMEKSLNWPNLENYLEGLLRELTWFLGAPREQVGLGILTSERSVEFCVELGRNATVQQYNSQYRGKNKPTDVLSFPVFENLREISSDDLPPGELSLGDVLIGYEKACEQAREFGVTLEEELLHLTVHGVIHLCGYDHEISTEEEKIMQSLEKRFLDAISNEKKK